MVIKNGTQTIKMGQDGMLIQHQGGQRVKISNNRVQIFHQQSQYPHFVNTTFNVHTNYNHNYADSNDESYEEESNEEYFSESSFSESSVDDQYANEEEESINYSLQNNQGYDMNMGNMGWHYHTQISVQIPNLNSNSSTQEMYAQTPQPKSQGLTKSQINQLPTSIYQAHPKQIKPLQSRESMKRIHKNEENMRDPCSICIVEYKNGDKMKTLPCKHKFHKNCIDKWLGIKSDCPMCKYNLLS